MIRDLLPLSRLGFAASLMLGITACGQEESTPQGGGAQHAAEKVQAEAQTTEPFYKRYPTLVGALSPANGFAYFSGHLPGAGGGFPVVYADPATQKFVVVARPGRYEFSSLVETLPFYKAFMWDVGYDIPGGKPPLPSLEATLLIDRASLKSHKEYEPARIALLGAEANAMLGKVRPSDGLDYLSGYSDQSRDNPALWGSRDGYHVVGWGTKEDFALDHFNAAVKAYQELLKSRSIPERFN